MYVPGLKKHSVSIAMLDDSGFAFLNSSESTTSHSSYTDDDNDDYYVSLNQN